MVLDLMEMNRDVKLSMPLAFVVQRAVLHEWVCLIVFLWVLIYVRV